MSTQPEFGPNCWLCGAEDDDVERCAGCGRDFCPNCGDWCHAEFDEANGDYFCEECQDETPVDNQSDDE